jgi:hypothetical protein
VTTMEATMRVIYVRLLISGMLVATMLALGTFGPAIGFAVQ